MRILIRTDGSWVEAHERGAIRRTVASALRYHGCEVVRLWIDRRPIPASEGDRSVAFECRVETGTAGSPDGVVSGIASAASLIEAVEDACAKVERRLVSARSRRLASHCTPATCAA